MTDSSDPNMPPPPPSPPGTPPPGTPPPYPPPPYQPPANPSPTQGYPPEPPPGHGYQPAPIPGQYGPPQPEDPGKVLGIVGFVLAFIFQVAGLVVSIIAFLQSKRAGYKNPLALAGIIVSAGLMLLGIIVLIFVLVGLAVAYPNGLPYYGL